MTESKYTGGLWLIAVLMLLAPGASDAQHRLRLMPEGTPGLRLQSLEVEPALRLFQAEPGAPSGLAPQASSPSAAVRVLAELLGGLIGAPLGALGGYLLGAGVCQGSGGQPFTLGCLPQQGIPALLGATLGGAWGAWAGGVAMGGKGSFGFTLLGTSVGIVLGLLTGPALGALAVLTLPLLTLTGAAVGFELSQLAPPPAVGLAPGAGPGAWAGHRNLGMGIRF